MEAEALMVQALQLDPSAASLYRKQSLPVLGGQSVISSPLSSFRFLVSSFSSFSAPPPPAFATPVPLSVETGKGQQFRKRGIPFGPRDEHVIVVSNKEV